MISFVFLMIFLFLSIAIKNFMFFRIAIISLFIILGSLRMEIYKYPNIKTKDTLKLKVIVPSKGIVAIEGIGILKTNLYPSEYEVIGYIKNDSFIVISFEKVRNENVIYKKLDEFIRQNAFKFEDYAISTALLLNNREFIPFEVKNAFAQTGMYHLLAISGLHISIIFAIISFFLSIFYIPKKLNFIISTIIIFFYVLILDFIPSAFRAFLFALIFSIANLFERKVNMLNVWGLSLLINLLISPIEIYDIGFQLSYLAVLGIIYSPFNYSENYILNILKSSISAQLFTTPILLYHFSYAPILYFFANIFTIPISTLLLINLMLCLIFPFIEQLWISLHLINLLFIKSIMFLESLNLPTLKFSINSKSLFIILGLIFFIVSVWKIKFSSLNLPKLLKKKEM
ncbi:MAG: ComEC/Rec2 family competence protein [candidate division WOR-3 bacterium]